jgi:hypothetical protein
LTTKRRGSVTPQTRDAAPLHSTASDFLQQRDLSGVIEVVLRDPV